MECCVPSGRKLGRFGSPSKVFMGLLDGSTVEILDSEDVSQVISRGARPTGEVVPLDGLKVLSPVTRPSKMICVGLNYRSHIKEMGWEIPAAPIIFSKPSSAIIGPGDAIRLPPQSSRVDFEGESAIIIGKKARSTASGLEHVFGYTCINDVTARDLQKTDPDWTRAKGFDTFAPIGPFISPAAPTKVTTRLNGRVVQSSPLSDRVFGDAALVEYISGIMTLEPGDVIATGTPSGIAPVAPGDRVEVELDGIGCLGNPVVGDRPGRQEV